MAQHRADRINEEVKKELTSVLSEMKDPRICAMVSVISVEVTNDLRYAKAYISILGDPEQVKSTFKAIKSAAGFIRREIAHRMKLRQTPEFIFTLDDSISHGAHIAELLKQVSLPGDEEEDAK